MNKTRVMPALLLRGQGLVKTVKFKDPKYVGDPINAVRLFNEKEVDELVFLDIAATPERRGPNFDLLTDIASEAFMPMAYGGGIATLEQVRRIFELGFEKVIINSVAHRNPDLIAQAAVTFGSQSIVGCVDVRRTLLGHYEMCSASARFKEKVSLVEHLATLTRQLQRQWLIVGGWECQDLSPAGHSKGLTGSRSSTLSPLVNILATLQRLQQQLPPAYLIENVAMQFNHRAADIRNIQYPLICESQLDWGNPTA